VNDAAITDDVDLEVDGEGVAPKKKLSGKKIVLFFVLPLLLVGGSTAALLFSGLFGGSKEHASPHAAAQSMAAPKPVFFDLPDMLVNLNTTGRRPVFLKMQVSLQLGSDADVPRLQSMSPRIIDTFQVYLRELRVDDLRGSAGIYRLREELLARVNAVVSPTRVKDVLFKEMLVQ
jgi:flagellar FliL protein